MSISTQSPRLAIVIVNYNSWPDVVRLVGSLSQEPELVSGVCQIVVVDNASGGPVPAELASDRPGLRLIQRPNNAGFAAGVNAGWRAV